MLDAADQGCYVIVPETRAKLEWTDRLLKQRINWTALRTPSRLG